jgi:mannitol 2-dehydrogenase
MWDRLLGLALKAKVDPVQWLTMDDIYGDVAKDESFRASFAGWLNMLWRDGTARTLKSYVGA